MLISSLWLLAALLGILLCADFFTNAVEWLGRKLRLGEGAIGSVLAGVGTALPETLIPLMAFLTARGAVENIHIGIGAILGAPFMLSTLAMAVTGLAVLFRVRRRRLTVNRRVFRRDLLYFLPMFGAAVLAGFLEARPLQWAIAAGLLACYGIYLVANLRESGEHGERLAPIRLLAWPVRFESWLLHRLGNRPRRVRSHWPDPRYRWVLLQLLVALGGLILGARLFVEAIKAVSVAAGVSPLVVSLILTPIATELPEKFNSVIWIRQGKDTLALGNITGAMVFQSSIPVTVGILLTNWDFHLESRAAIASALIALTAASFLLVGARTRNAAPGRSTLSPWLLMAAGVLYLVFLGILF